MLPSLFWTRPPPSRTRRTRTKTSGLSWPSPRARPCWWIAHRLSTIQNADQIVVLEKGQIVDRGTQSELLSRCPAVSGPLGSPCGSENLGGHFRGKGGELRCFIVSDAICGGRRAIGDGCSWALCAPSSPPGAPPGPVMLAAWALGRLIGNAWGENELSASLPWLCLGGIVVLILLRFFFTYWKNRLQESIGTERAADQRMELGDVLKRVSLGYFARNNLGDILTALTTELSTLELQSMKMVGRGDQRLYPGGGDPAVRGHLLPACGSGGALGCSGVRFCPAGASAGRAPVPHRWDTGPRRLFPGAAIEYIYGLPVVKSFGQDGVSVQRFRKACRDNKAIRIKNEFGFVPWNCLHLFALRAASVGLVLIAGQQALVGTLPLPYFLMIAPVLLHHLRQRGGHQRRGTRPVGDRLSVGPAGGAGAHRLHRQGRPGDRPGEVRCGPFPCILWLRPAGGAPRL